MEARLCGRAHAVERNQGKPVLLIYGTYTPGSQAAIESFINPERMSELRNPSPTTRPYCLTLASAHDHSRECGSRQTVSGGARIISIEPHATKLQLEDRLGESYLTAASSVERLRCDRGKYGHDFRLAQYGVAIGPSKMGSPGAIFRTVLGNFMLRSRQGLRIAASKF
jgi:hypothetical protein